MAIALLQHATASSTGFSATTAAKDFTGCTLLVAAVTSFNTGATISMADSSSNTWQPLTKLSSAGNNELQLFYAFGPTVSSSQTFTGTSTNSFIDVFVTGYSGALTTSGVFDTQSGTTTAATTTTAQPGSITPAQSGELFVTASANGGIVFLSSMTIDSGFTITDSDLAHSTETGGMAYFVNSGSGALNPTWTWTTNDVTKAINCVMAAFKAAAGVAFQGEEDSWNPVSAHRPAEPVVTVY